MKHSAVFLCLSGVLLLGTGCSLNLKPSSRQVEDFIQRREFVIAAIDDITEPMPGTSYYPGLSQMMAAKSRKDMTNNLLNAQFKDGIRKAVSQHNGFAFVGNIPLDFDVELKDELIKSIKIEDIPDKLNRYYARKLEAAGWIIGGWRSGGTSRECLDSAYVWTDKWFKQGDALVESDQYSMPRGYLNVIISVRLDIDKKRAHISISAPVGVIGIPSL